MESVAQPLDVRVQYTVLTKVQEIKWLNQPDGWFVHFEGSRESLNFGIERPQWEVGQQIKITFEGLDAKPSEPPV